MIIVARGGENMIITSASQAESVTGRDVGRRAFNFQRRRPAPPGIDSKQRPVGEPDKQVHLLTQQFDVLTQTRVLFAQLWFS